MFTPGDKIEFGHYTILRELGSGGMGVVYHCRDEFLQREIAIKMMLPELMAEDDTVDVFRQEARLAAQLEHPGIVTIHNIGVESKQDSTHHYIAMEFLPGGSLRKQIGKELVALEQALEWMKQLAQALNYAHKRGVVHQDIKPDNIFITQEGNLKIGDFGLALIATGPALERHAQGKGTPAYMSPELCRGEQRDHRSDIYSLGAVFYEILTGQPPFQADGMIDMAVKHTTAPVPSAAELRPEIPLVLDKAVRYMMVKTPDERLQSLSDLLPILEKLLLEMKITRLGVTLPQSDEEAKEDSADKTKTEAMDFSPKGDSKEKEAPTKKAVLLKEKSNKPESEKSDGAAISFDKNKEINLELLWTFKSCGPVGWFAAPVMNRTRKHVYLSSADGVVYALDMATGACAWYMQTSAPLLGGVLASTDFVYCPASNGNLHCVSAVDGKEVWKYEGDSPIVSNPVSSQELIIVTALNGSVKALSAKDGSQVWAYRCDGGLATSAQVVENLVFVASKDKGLHAIDIQSGNSRWVAESTAPLLASVLASTDSAYCAAIDGAVLAVDIASGKMNWIYQGASAFLCRGTLEFSTLNYCSKDGVLHSLDKFKGSVIWKSKCSGPVLGGVASASGNLYVSSRNGVLHCFNGKTGELNWFAGMPAALESVPLVSGNCIYQGTVTGDLCAFAPPAKSR